MLELVSSHPRKRIALDVDAALADFLKSMLQRARPELQVVADGDCDLLISMHEPADPPAVPTLWIADVDRRPHLVQLSARVWKLSTPFTPRRLQRILDELLR